PQREPTVLTQRVHPLTSIADCGIRIADLKRRGSHLSLIRNPNSAISLVTECDHRVYLRRAPRGDEAGQERYAREQQRDEGEGQGVAGADAVEQPRQEPRRRDRGEESKP